MKQRTADVAGTLGEEIPIDGDDLRHINNRILGKARGVRGKEHVSRGVEQAKVRRQDEGECGAEAAAIERVALNDEHRPTESGLGALWFTEVSPPDVATLDYHDSFGMDRFCTRRVPASRRLSSVA